MEALAFFVLEQDNIRDGLIESDLLIWMEEISDKLPDEFELQVEIIFFIHNCLIKRNWPLMTKLMPGIRTLSKVFIKLSSLFPFEQSLPDHPWREEAATQCLSLILTSFEHVHNHNQDLFEQLALKYAYHSALVDLTNYAKDLKLVGWSLGIISDLCSARKLQVRRFLELDILKTIKSHLLNQAFIQDSSSSLTDKDNKWIEQIHTEACIALSNIACDKTPGITNLLIESNIYPEAVFPLYFSDSTSFMMKHELAFCVCNSLLHCTFGEAYRLLSSG